MESRVINIELFDTETQRVRKVKDHSVEFTDAHLIVRANYLCDEKHDGEWKEKLWRFWEEYHLLKYISRFGITRMMIEEEENFHFHYSITVLGTDEDIIFLFETKEKCLQFHEQFKAYMLS